MNGGLWIDGHPRLLLIGEYPYYRDEPQRWLAKLNAMRRAGLEVVSFYVPWRHHERSDGGESPYYCFDHDGNRNLVGFLDAVVHAGLLALAKPGPFVHAELPYGGLPDRISPDESPDQLGATRQAAQSANGTRLRSRRMALPSVHDPAYRADAGAWLAAVGHVLRPFLYPQGPIVAVQVGNVGNYLETDLPIDALDYAPAGLAAFDRFAPGVGPPRRWSDPVVAHDLVPFLRWGQWSSTAMERSLLEYGQSLALDVPMLVNVSPPARAGPDTGHYDAWLARVGSQGRAGLEYGYTSWAGNAIVDDEALVNYVMAAKRGRGPNIEENWSLRWVDESCRYPVVPIHHALLGIACGATGLAVYTACATDQWGPHLVIDRGFLAETTGDPGQLDPPYGEGAPIDEMGKEGPGFAPLQLLTSYLAHEGPGLLRASPEPGLTWGVYRPYCFLQAWAPPTDARVAGHQLAPPAADTLVPFVRHCLRRSIPFGFTDLETDASLRSAGHALIVTSASFMAAEVQLRLASFLDDGGCLLLLGDLPRLDELFRPCTALAERLGAEPAASLATVVSPSELSGAGLVAVVDRWIAQVPGLPHRLDDPTRVELRLVSSDDVFVFAFNRLLEPRTLVTFVGGQELSVALAPGGVGAVRITADRLVSCFVKGVNEQLGLGVPVVVRFGDDQISSTDPCDLAMTPGSTSRVIATAGGGAHNRVALSDLR